MFVDLPAKCALLLSVFKETSFSSTALRKILRYKISWESVQWEPSYCVRTDRHDEANSRFSQYSGARLKTWDAVQRNGLERRKKRRCCRYDDVGCSVTACYAAFTFVQRFEPLVLNMLHNNRGFHTAGWPYSPTSSGVCKKDIRSIIEQILYYPSNAHNYMNYRIVETH